MATLTSRWWALGALVLSALVIGMDATVLNVALPTLAADLHASTGDLQWIVDAYLIPFAALMLPAGALGDRFGRRRLLLAGLAAFGIASVAATYAGGTGALVAARALMGAGGAVIMPLSTSILPVVFPPGERGRAIAVWTAAMALGLPLGPVVGGYLLDHFWWGSVFLVNIPMIVISMAAVAAFIPESRDPAAPRTDLPGALLSVTGLAALVYGVIEAPARGWGDPRVLAGLGAGVALLAVFVRVEARARQPMMDLGLFRSRVFVWGAAGATFVSLGMSGVLFVVPQHLQAVLGHDALGTGLRVIPMVAGLMAGGLAGERLTARLGLRVVMPVGLAVLAAGFFLGSATSVSGAFSAYGFVAAWLAVLGAGVGLAMVPAMDGVLATLPEERSGSGSATLQTVRQVGGALGVAGLGSMLSAAYASGLPSQVPEGAADSITAATALAARAGDAGLLSAAREAFVDGMDLVLLVCGPLSVLTAVLVAVFLPGSTAGRGKTAESGHELTSAR
ncbi:DHA2 family efflux MFS transporter permease subunit [Microbispora hainanensis]|uniref:DHA2 family efflux MFS transporter permease subunit n=1 Tax=Microbispora hainanensis TaxID=568844 RepID=A0A544YTL6_9ACTN|nr:DHA2 family efflux MFS transporter permease subunit [Microbispora hainanensis]TQS20080.1 DHA2 family efflux MFS transporter permease subunit [Microbispora hainanensis]